MDTILLDIDKLMSAVNLDNMDDKQDQPNDRKRDISPENGGGTPLLGEHTKRTNVRSTPEKRVSVLDRSHDETFVCEPSTVQFKRTLNFEKPIPNLSEKLYRLFASDTVTAGDQPVDTDTCANTLASLKREAMRTYLTLKKTSPGINKNI